MNSEKKAFVCSLVVALLVALGLGGELLLRMHASKPRTYDGGTSVISFEEGVAHGAEDEVLVTVPAESGPETAVPVAGTSDADRNISVVSEEEPVDVWKEDKASGYTGFTTRTQLPASDSIGMLEIPSIGLSVNVYDSEDDMADMDKGLSHFQTTSYWDGNIGMCGHNGNLAFSFFGKLHNVKKGDVITYQTEFGTRSYVVSSIQTIADDDWSHLERTEDNRLTLITCVSDPAKRLCVQAVEQ